jgi:hypothetical protein
MAWHFVGPKMTSGLLLNGREKLGTSPWGKLFAW